MGTPYIDVSNQETKGYVKVHKLTAEGKPPVFAPPALLIRGDGYDRKSLLISPTANILVYLGPKLGLVPEGDEVARYHINGLTLTALDLCNEAHDVHHGTAL
ncbi:hypothetical protein LIPSTDRAFT_6733 [Lipomyces starkeyi NRRL Y-11557]|uniref:GST N-terminal domain-containing protein n=1 Tax=Lipomyces starkeyi NRRL Y-11557 TaxID=675824 RepID=A0A1E3PW73_LIPST|nr:hypothetical protein LIPSTDRAFT_6733 [Lipomyces starkeyi NRRL Y-11557]